MSDARKLVGSGQNPTNKAQGNLHRSQRIRTTGHIRHRRIQHGAKLPQMDKTPEHRLPSMGTELLISGLNFDGLSPRIELDCWGHRLVSRCRVAFTLELFHSQQLPNGGSFSTALLRLRDL